MLRDSQGHLHLGRSKSAKKLFSKNGIGAERYAKSEYGQCLVASVMTLWLQIHSTYSHWPLELIKYVASASPPRVLHFVYGPRDMNVVMFVCSASPCLIIVLSSAS